MIEILKKSDCCGCEACVQACPKQCITMKDEEEGFAYPVVDTNRCVDCHVCEKVCPVINYGSIDFTLDPQKVYAAKNTDDSVRMASSSGGIFFNIARKVTDGGGVVFGAAFDESFGVRHIFAQTQRELLPMMRSKYVQSGIDGSYKAALNFLKAGRTVLFSGTPCQIAGLNLYLKKPYSNLITVDIVCHGVPAPDLWKKYLNEMQGSRCDDVVAVSFREKTGYSWSHYGLKIVGNGHDLYDDYAANSSYMRAFLSNNSLRPVCYNCRHKRRSGADITLGDFWGINKLMPDYADEQGVSLVILNTPKGQAFFNADEFDCREAAIGDVMNLNKSYWQNASKPLSRKRFFRLVKNSRLTLDDIVRRTIPRPSEQTGFQKIIWLPFRVCQFVMRKLSR